MVNVQRLPVLIPYDGPNGKLTVLGQDGLPFTVCREFWLTDVPKTATRADHAHMLTRQVLVAIKGEWRARIEYGAGGSAVVRLREGEDALYVPPMSWLTLHSSGPDAIILVLADRPYSANEYIRTRARWRELLAGESRA